MTAHVVEHFGVRGQQVVIEWLGKKIAFDGSARGKAVTLTKGPYEARQRPGNRAQVGRHLNAPHRSREHDRRHVAASNQGAQANTAPHRMGNHVPGFWKVLLACKGAQGGPVLLKVQKPFDMTDHGVSGQSVRHALTPPVDRHHVKACLHEVSCGSAIFFKVFGAPRQQEHRALAVACRCVSCPEPHLVRTAQPDSPRFGTVCQIVAVGRRIGHQARVAASFIAMPMSPSMVRRPDMKADVGLSEPSKISR